MNAGQTKRRSRTRPSGRVLMTTLVIVLIALLLPMGFVFERFWSSAGSASVVVSSERDGVTYVRPLTRLLASLVDAQSAAVRGAPVDTAAVRAAIENVNRVDRDSGDPLKVRPRWSQVATEVESTLGQPVSGQDALRAYAGPIGLTQALLVRIGDVSNVVRDPGPDAFHLIDTALLRVPEVMVNAENIAALARVNRTPQIPGIAVAQDRITVASTAIGVGLRMGDSATTPDSVDINLLKPLDEFAAAVDALAQASSVADLSSGSARADIDAAQAQVQRTAVALQNASLNGFESLLDKRALSLTAQRGTALVAGALAVLAAAVLLWLCLPSAAKVAAPSPVEPMRRHPQDERARLAHLENTSDLVNARDLLSPQLVHVGRAVQAKRRRERDDSR